jgi:hypothetical protein
VDESPWIRVCPRCGNSDKNQQCPITLGTPRTCSDCSVNPWKTKGGRDIILYYLCTACGQHYLTPKVNPEDQLLELFKP